MDLETNEKDKLYRGPQDGVYIDGLFMDGARWDREMLCVVEAAPREISSPLPIIHFTPRDDYTPPETEYQCPLYKTAQRHGVLSTTGQSTNYVLSISIPLPPDGPAACPNFWVLQGVAALCALSD